MSEGTSDMASADKSATAGEGMVRFGPGAMLDAVEQLKRLGIEMRAEQYRHARERKEHERLMGVLLEEVAEAIRYFKRTQEDTEGHQRMSPPRARQAEPLAGGAHHQESTPSGD